MKIVCSVKEACKLMEHMNENDTVILTVIDKKTYLHDKPRKIKKKNGEELIKQAEDIFYQDNDFFGRLSLYGVLKENDIIHNILFPQLDYGWENVQTNVHKYNIDKNNCS